MDPTLEGLWKKVLEDWDDDALHGKLISYAQTSDQLGQAAGLYKSVANAEDSPYRLSPTQVLDAKKRMNGIAMLAVMHLEAAKTEAGPPKGLFWVRVAAAILVVATAVLVVVILQK
ncbi:MAG: hypothetical protein U0414_32435 [Polyangiaceae bacterium]